MIEEEHKEGIEHKTLQVFDGAEYCWVTVSYEELDVMLKSNWSECKVRMVPEVNSMKLLRLENEKETLKATLRSYLDYPALYTAKESLELLELIQAALNGELQSSGIP